MKTWKTAYISILIAETLAIAGFATSMPVIPLYLQDMGITDPAALKYWSGLVQSVGSITLAVFAPLWGGLADAYGKRVMLLRSMFGGAVVVSLMAFVTNPWQLFALRALQGCLTGTVAAATVMVAGITPAARIGFSLGLLQTGIAVGSSLGPLIGGVVSDFLGRPAAFIATGVILSAAGFIVLFGVDNDKKAAAPERGRARFAPDLKAILSSPLLPSLMMVSFALQASMAIPTAMMPLLVQEMIPEAGLVGSTTGMVLGAGAAASAVAAAFIGRFSGKLGYGRTLFLCLAGGAILTLPQALAGDPLQLTVMRVASMLFLGGAMPSLNALIAINADKDKQGAIFGLNTSITSIGMALGPVIGSGVAAAVSFRAVFVAAAAILGATVAWMQAAARAAAKRSAETAAKPAAESAP